MSLNNLKDFKEGKHEKYEDYLLAKADLAKQIKITQELEKIKVAEENKVIAQN